MTRRSDQKNTSGGQATVIEAFDQACELFAEQVAVSAGDESVTYGVLNEQANGLAARLAPRSANNLAPVAILADHHISGLVAMLAVLKAGRPYVFLPVRQPQQQQLAILQSLDASILLADSPYYAPALQLDHGRLAVINVDEPPARHEVFRAATKGRPEDVVSIYFTSGSTGQPKGVMRTNQNHLARLAADRAIHGEGPGSHLSLLRRMSFSASSATIFNALLNGATLHLADPEKMSMKELADWLVERRISSLRMATPLLRQLLDAIADDMCFPDLRFCRPAGRLLRRDVQRLWHHVPHVCQVGHGLASAETSLVSYFELQRDALPEGEVIPLGRPVDGVQVAIVDAQAKPVAAGETGRALVSSPMVTPGYWHDEVLTRESIEARPAPAVGHTILTGDLVRRRADGLLAFAGRADLRVKIRGFTVELEAIEAALEQQPGVVQAAVKAGVDQAGDAAVTGYVEMEAGARTSLAAMRRDLADTLPDYMIPARLVALDRLPTLGASGKVNRAALPDPDRSRPELDNPYVAPSSPTEIKLAAIWSELLHMDQIGVNDSFFDLGGQSLLAARMLTLIRRDFGLDLPLATLFAAETTRQLASKLDRFAADAAEKAPADLEVKLRLLGL